MNCESRAALVPLRLPWADLPLALQARQDAKGETSTKSFQEWAGGEQVTLAIVFTDVVGSTALGEEIRSFGSVTALCPAGLPTTPEAMRQIFAQGFWGKATTVNTEVVARQTLDRALKGKPVFVPGLLNGMLQGLASLVPASLSARMVGKRWREAQESAVSWRQSLPSA